MLKKIRFRHDCDLAADTEDEFIGISPYASPIWKLCYRIRCYLTIQHSYESRQYFRSHASFLQEKRRHLETSKYKYIIHPFSRFAVHKKITMCFVWIIAFLLTPYFGSFEAKAFLRSDKSVDPFFLFLIRSTDIIIIMDIFSQFFMGYMIHKTREIVLDPQRTIKHYLSTYFFFDCVSVICSNASLIFWYLNMWHKLVIYQFHVLRWVRLKTLIEDFDQFLKMFNIQQSIRTSFFLFLVSMFCLHWWTCLMGLIPVVREIHHISNNRSWFMKLKQERESTALSKRYNDGASERTILENYFQYMSITVCHFFGAGIGHYQTKDQVEMMILAFVMISGLVFYIITLAKVLQLFGMVNISETKFEELITQSGEYMVTKKFPTNLRKRIHKYYDYKFSHTFFSERQILDSLSEHLRMEILLYSCRHLIDEVQIFKGLSRAAVGCILALLKQEIYLPKDVIMSTVDSNGTIYFVLYGTCGVNLLSGREAMHIEDGSHFGVSAEDNLDILYTVVALEACEIYTLSTDDVLYCCRHYPEITNKLDTMFKSKAKYYNSVFSVTTLEDEVQANDIVLELRKGNILEHGRAREDFFHIKYT